MLLGAFQKKERRILIAFLVLVLIIIGVFIYISSMTKKRYEEQTVMAEEFLEAGNYEQAIEAYLKAMSMKNSNQELLSIGLAEAYGSMNNYDKAMEVLRNSYMQNRSITVKEKIEEITTRKTDYEFLVSITHADTYFANGEYEKAIAEYEKAKLIKSKEEVSYKRIAEAYIAMGNYDLAREEVMEGLALTQSDALQSTLDKVDSYLLKAQYEEIINAASEYIYQENYEEAINLYKEAIRMLPKEEGAYKGLAEVYITLNEYDKSISILENTLQNINSSALEETLNRATTLRDERNYRLQFLEKLYTAFLNTETDKLRELMEDTFFTMKIAGSEPVYYSSEGEGKITDGKLMIIYDKNTVYAGEVMDGMKKGIGTYLMRLDTNSDQGWYYYKGEWDYDIPNGMGVTKEELSVTDENDENHISLVVTEGIFLHAMEHSLMHKTFYQDGKEIGSVEYKAKNGVPQPYQDEEELQNLSGVDYIIGEWYRNGEPTGEFYSVEQNTLWGVRTFIK